MTGERAAPWVRYAFLGALAAAVYSTSFPVPFLSGDDSYYVTGNSRTRRPGLGGFLNVWSMEDVWREQIIEYFPLRDTVYWGLWQAFGADPAPYHAANVAAHVVAVLLLYTLMLRLGFDGRVAFWGTALFAAHPIHVESVTWISGLKDPMFTSLVLGSLLFYVRHRGSRRPLDYALCLALLVAALLVKSIALVTPLLMLAVDRLCEPRATWRQAAARAAGPAVITAVFLGQYLMVGRAGNIIIGPHGGTWARHWFLAGWALVRYVQQAFIPATFSFRYCFAPPRGWLDWRLLPIALAPPAALALLAAVRRRAPRAALLWIWFFAFLLPVMNLVPFPAVMADRYLYASSAATSMAMAWAALRLPGRTPQLLLGAAVLVFGGATLARGVVWQDEANLWAEAALDPECREDLEPHGALVLLEDAFFEKDPQARWERYEVGLSTPGFSVWGKQHQCTFLALGARAAVDVGQRVRGVLHAREAVHRCPERPDAWDSLTAATSGLDPAAALKAALRAYRLQPTPERQWRLGLAQVTAGDPSGASVAAEAVAQEPEQLCGLFTTWLERYRPEPGAAIDRARQICARISP